MMGITYKVGDFTKHNFVEKTICPQVVNNRCVNASGIILAFKKKWPNSIKELEDFYRDLFWDHHYDEFNSKEEGFYQAEWQLGHVHFYQEDNVIVANMLAQSTPGGDWFGGKVRQWLRPIRLDCLRECMLRVVDFGSIIGAKEIVTGKFGSLRAGASWENEIEPMINELWGDLKVTIYNYEEKT